MSGRLIAALAALLLAACGKLDREGVVILLEPGWAAETVLGPGDGIAAPDGLLWADGRLYIADEGGSAVRVWTPGEGVETLADARSGLSSPEDIVRAADGTLYVSDDDAGGVWRIAGGRTDRLGADLVSTEGLALAPNGILIAGDQRAHALFAVGERGARPLQRGIAKPESLAFDDRGNFYVADNRANILYLLGRDGRVHRPIRDRAGFSPESILFAGGTLFVTDSDHGRLYRYTPEDGLAAIALFGGSLANVQGVAADDGGNLYVSVQSDLAAGRGYVIRLSRR